MLVGTIYAGQPKSGMTLSDATKRRYRKEAIYVGNFNKRTETTEQPFNVEAGTLSYWVDTFKAMNTVGVEVPMPVGHTEDPAKKRATVVNMEVAKNEKGLDALFVTYDFRDAQAEQDHKNSDVSIYVPQDPFFDGLGNKYVRPIRHIAFTDYPVVPGLGSAALVASFNGAEGTKKMPIDEKALATKLSVDPNDPEIDTKIMAAIDKLLEAAKPKEPAAPPAPAAAASSSAGTGVSSGTLVTKVSAGILKSVKENRENQINSLLLSGKISTAAANDMKADFCTDASIQAVGLALSNDTPFNDGFDSFMKSLAKNSTGVNLHGKTGAQVPDGTLSKDGTLEQPSPLVVAAERFAERYKK